MLRKSKNPTGCQRYDLCERDTECHGDNEEIGNHSYTIITYTGHRAFAGTDSNIYVTLYGACARTKELWLKKSAEYDDPFECGQEDRFKKVLTKDLGYIHKVKVRSDNCGVNPGWFLNKIVLVEDLTGTSYVFRCYDWLHKTCDKNNLTRELQCKALPVVSVDTLMQYNGPKHHLKDCVRFTLRRGQTFKLKIQLAKKYNKADYFYFTLSCGRHASYKEKTLISIDEKTCKEFTECKKKEEWGYTIRDITHTKQIEVEIYIPCAALLASYVMMIDTECDTVYAFPCQLTILANPWHKDATKCQLLERKIKSSMNDACRHMDKQIKSCCDLFCKQSRISDDCHFDVIDVDTCMSINGSLQYTDKFKTKSIVLRRGQSFKLKMKLSKNYTVNGDFHFALKTGPKPRDVDKTFVTVVRKSQDEYYDCTVRKEWAYTVRDVSHPKNILVDIFIPADALTGQFELSVEREHQVLYKCQIFILFNPWCEEDEVYMECEDDLREYVLRQHGILYLGKYTKPLQKDWFYGQFEQVSLEVAMKILEEIVPIKNRASAIAVSRFVSSKANSADNHGIVSGNWSNNYEGGKEPYFWSSTTDIFDRYVVDMQPVKYGQCWVYGAVVTTVMRTLGIPCRTVTCYNAAHDTDGNCITDLYFDKEHRPLEELTRDSIWNFHVWNDAWMARRDLPDGYGGWNAIDATPQEVSGGKFRLGPTSLVAIKFGEVERDFDTKFVFSEVNSDVYHWIRDKCGKLDLFQIDKDRVGKMLSTKAVGCNERNDITTEYKFAEGTKYERLAVRNALRRSVQSEFNPPELDVEMNIALENDHIQIGQDVCVYFDIVNNTCDDVCATFYFTVKVVSYDGKPICTVMDESRNERIRGSSGDKISRKICYSAFREKLGCHYTLQITGKLVLPSGYMIPSQDICIIELPELDIKVPSTVICGRIMTFVVSFKNPFDTALTGCTVYVEGTAISKKRSYEFGNVSPHSVFNPQDALSIVPERQGRKSLLVKFRCNELAVCQKLLKINVS